MCCVVAGSFAEAVFQMSPYHPPCRTCHVQSIRNWNWFRSFTYPFVQHTLLAPQVLVPTGSCSNTWGFWWGSCMMGWTLCFLEGTSTRCFSTHLPNVDGRLHCLRAEESAFSFRAQEVLKMVAYIHALLPWPLEASNFPLGTLSDACFSQRQNSFFSDSVVTKAVSLSFAIFLRIGCMQCLPLQTNMISNYLIEF